MPPSSTSSAKSDKAPGKSKSQPGTQSHNSYTNLSTPASFVRPGGRTTILAGEMATSPEPKNPRVDILEKLLLATQPPPPEKSLVHYRRAPVQPGVMNQGSVPSGPTAAQDIPWSTLRRDALGVPVGQETPSPSPRKSVDIVFDPSKPAKDVAVRLHFPVVRDLEDELEEFCRLRRLGLFHKAEDYFIANLDSVSNAPYFMIQRSEALLAAGDYKGVTEVINQHCIAGFGRLPGKREAQQLAANLELIGLLSQPSFPQHATRALAAALDGLPDGMGTLRLGSAEVQALSLSLRVLHYFVEASSQTYNEQSQALRDQARACCDWSRLYHDLLGGERIWDLRDLMTAAVPVFGFEGTLSQLLGEPSTPRGLEALIDDWIPPGYYGVATLGLLDLFTSLILQNPGDDSRTALLLHHSTTLAKSIQQNNKEHVRTRPFIQFILARAVVEIEQALKGSDMQDLSEPGGLLVTSGGGVHLPIYVPAKHDDRPGWGRFYARTTPTLRKSVSVALQAARFTGDYALQSTAWKLLILQSQNPISMIEELAELQLEVQGDKEGFLGTCLSKYLTTTDMEDERRLLGDLDKLDSASNGSYLRWGFNASLLWARSIIQGHLESSTGRPTDNVSGAMQDPGKVCRDEMYAYSTRLSDTVVHFLKSTFNITVPRPLHNGVSSSTTRDSKQAPQPVDQTKQGTPILNQDSDDGGSLGLREIPRKPEDEMRDSIAKLQDHRRLTEGHLEPVFPVSPPSPPKFRPPPPPPLASKPPTRPNHVRSQLPLGAHAKRERSRQATGPSKSRVEIVDMWSDNDHTSANESGSNDAVINDDVRRQYARAQQARREETIDWSEYSDDSSDEYNWRRSPVDSDEDGVFFSRRYSTVRPQTDINVQSRRMTRPRLPFRPGASSLRAEPPISPPYCTTAARELGRDRDEASEWPNPFVPSRFTPSGGGEFFAPMHPYPSALPRGYTSLLGALPPYPGEIPPHYGLLPPHSVALPTYPGVLPPNSGGPPSAPGYPPSVYYGPTQYPQQPDYFPVSGWPTTWQQDASRLFGSSGPPTESHPHNTSSLVNDLLREGIRRPKQAVPLAENEWSSSGLGAHPAATQPPLPELTGNRDATAAVKAAEANHEGDNTHKGANHQQGAGKDQEKSDDDETAAQDVSPRVGVQDGLPKLDFPPSLLDDNTLTVFVQSKTDPQKAKMYTVAKDGVTESEVMQVVGSNARQQSPNPRRDSPRIRRESPHVRREPPGFEQQSPRARRRASHYEPSPSKPAPSSHKPIYAVPDAPRPPPAESVARHAKGLGGHDAEGSKKRPDRMATAEPGAPKHNRRVSIIKDDVSTSFAKPEDAERKLKGANPVASPGEIPARESLNIPVTGRPTAKGKEKLPVSGTGLSRSPIPPHGSANTSVDLGKPDSRDLRPTVESDGESDGRAGSPVGMQQAQGDERIAPKTDSGGNGEVSRMARANTSEW